MRNRAIMSACGAVALSTVACTAIAARGDINGFGNFSGFSVNQADSGPAPTVAPGSIHITNPTAGEQRSVFFNTPQSIAAFTANFTYQAQNSTSAFAGGCGAAFVIERSSQGANAVGSSTVSSTGISPSGAVTLELYDSSTRSAYYTNGAGPSGSPSTSPVNLLSGNPINVSLTYDGSILQETLKDSVTGSTFGASYLTNLPSILGNSSAFVGFTAATTGNQRADQTLSSFTFTSVPEPAPAFLLIAAAPIALIRLRHLA